MGLFGFGKKKANAPSPTAWIEASELTTDAKDYTSPSHFSITARDLMISQDELDTAFETARTKAEAGEPYGSALFFALLPVSKHSQFTDDMVDELPGWAFGDLPGEHFTQMNHLWALNTESDEKQQHNTFKRFAILAGWRPGDVNAYWWNYRMFGLKEEMKASRDPMGRDLLPEDLILRAGEVKVYAYLSGEAEKLKQEGGHA